jgi:DNA-binding response OmpR family regulator
VANILIVEDEAHIAAGLRFNLELEGHQVEVAVDGLVARRLLIEESRDYDLVILDLMLPHVSGFELCRAIRRKSETLPILMLTAKRDDPDKVYGLRLGADDYVTKPFNLEELLARIDAILRRKGWTAPAPVEHDVLVYGNVRIDFDTFEAKVDGSEVKLTPIEFGLMRVFRDNEGLVLSRDQLLEAVWGWQNPASTRTVDNFILRLRRSLEPVPSAPRHILSVRGAGYKFVR